MDFQMESDFVVLGTATVKKGVYRDSKVRVLGPKELNSWQDVLNHPKDRAKGPYTNVRVIIDELATGSTGVYKVGDRTDLAKTSLRFDDFTKQRQSGEDRLIGNSNKPTEQNKLNEVTSTTKKSRKSEDLNNDEAAKRELKKKKTYFSSLLTSPDLEIIGYGTTYYPGYVRIYGESNWLLKYQDWKSYSGNHAFAICESSSYDNSKMVISVDNIKCLYFGKAGISVKTLEYEMEFGKNTEMISSLVEKAHINNLKMMGFVKKVGDYRLPDNLMKLIAKKRFDVLALLLPFGDASEIISEIYAKHHSKDVEKFLSEASKKFSFSRWTITDILVGEKRALPNFTADHVDFLFDFAKFTEQELVELLPKILKKRDDRFSKYFPESIIRLTLRKSNWTQMNEILIYARDIAKLNPYKAFKEEISSIPVTFRCEFDVDLLFKERTLDINEKDPETGLTILHFLLKNSHIGDKFVFPKLKLCEKYGANFDVLDPKGNSLLWYCKKDETFLKKLIELHSVNVNIQNNEGKTILHHAADNLILQIYLLEKSKINANLLDHKGMNAFQSSFQDLRYNYGDPYQRDILFKLIQAYGSKGLDFNHVDNETKKSAIHLLAANERINDPEIFELIREHGGDLKAKDENGKTILDINSSLALKVKFEKKGSKLVENNPIPFYDWEKLVPLNQVIQLTHFQFAHRLWSDSITAFTQNSLTECTISRTKAAWRMKLKMADYSIKVKKLKFNSIPNTKREKLLFKFTGEDDRGDVDDGKGFLEILFYDDKTKTIVMGGYIVTAYNHYGFIASNVAKFASLTPQTPSQFDSNGIRHDSFSDSELDSSE